MIRFLRLTLLIMLTILMAGAMPAYAQQQPATTITPNQPGIAAGSLIRFSGSGFIKEERVAFWATAPNQAVLGGYFTFAQDDGTISFEFRPTADAISGTWFMTAYGLESKTPAITSFTVQGREANGAEREAWSDITVVNADGRIRFAATGFRERESVSYWFTGPDGVVYDPKPAGVRADANGRIDITYTAHEPAGAWVVTFQGLRSGVTRGVPFEVRAP